MDLSISVMLETCPNTLISYALFSSMFILMLHAMKSFCFYFHIHAFNIIESFGNLILITYLINHILTLLKALERHSKYILS
jgi:hypothetical protein